MEETKEKDEFEQAVEQYDLFTRDRTLTYKIDNELADVEEPLKYTSLSVNAIPIKSDILSQFKNVEDLYIGFAYKGNLSFIDNINPRKLIINRVISINELRNLNLTDVEELNICIETSEDPLDVEAPKLKKLVLSGDYKDNKKFRRLDLTGCSDIEEIIIKEGVNIDVYSMGRLEYLKKLCIYGGNIESLKWIAQYRNLEHLEIMRSHIKDISGLENLQKLRKLDLRNNEIESVDLLLCLSDLEYVNLYRNNISDRDMADKIETSKLVLTGTDYVVYHQIDLAVGNIGGICAKVDAEAENPVEGFPSYEQKRISEIRNLPRIDRIKLVFQDVFEKYYFELAPNRLLTSNDYDPLKAKEMYLKIMGSRFPFLKFTEVIKKDYQDERIKFCQKYTDDTLIVITCKNVFAITVKCQPYEKSDDGYGEIEITIPDTKRHISALRAVIDDLWSKYAYDLEITDYDFKIQIDMKYSGDFYSTDLAIPIMYAMYLAIHNRFKADIVMIGSFGLAENCESIPKKLYLTMAKNEGAREVLLYGNDEEWVTEYRKMISERYNLDCDFYESIEGIFY